jgi:hypothetical protein
VTSRDDGWAHPTREPAGFYFGNGGAPYLTLTWKAWGDDSAFAEGWLWTMARSCTPAYECPYHRRWVNIWLDRPRDHDGREYFTRMDAEFYHDGKVRLERLSLSAQGYWDGPLRWPWF